MISFDDDVFDIFAAPKTLQRFRFTLPQTPKRGQKKKKGSKLLFFAQNFSSVS